MPTVHLSKKTILNIIEKKLSDEELKKAISYLGTDLEGIEDDEIIVEIFPNRPDLLSEQGLGRALASYLGTKKGLAQFDVKKSDYQLTVTKDAKGVRPNTACAVVKNLKLDDARIKELIQIQEKLHITYGRNRKKCAIGIYPLEKISFPIELTAKDPKTVRFVPLESPNGKEMTGLQVLSQHPTGRDYAFLLEGMNKFPFFIDAHKNVLSMPPIINSHTVGKIEESTTDVFVECSGFDQKTLDICLNMIVATLSNMGGEIYEITLKNDVEGWTKQSPDFTPSEMSIDVDYVNTYLGVTLSEEDLKDCLERMGYDYDIPSKKVLVASYRADILHPIDLVEDIAIAYGYFNFTEEIPAVASIGARDKKSVMKSRVTDILAGLGLLETNTYCLTSKEQQKEILQNESELVGLANSVAEGYDSLRSGLLPSLLSILKNNKLHDYPQSFFEIGNTFVQSTKTETKVLEGQNICFVYAEGNANFTYAKQVLDYLMQNLNLTYDAKATTAHSAFMEGRVAEVFVSNESIGFVGQINPSVLELCELDVPVVGFELDLIKLISFVEE